MNLSRALVCLSAFGLLAPGACGQSSCPVFLRTEVEITGPDLTLADLLQPDSCPARVAAAAGIRLGAAPLQGSARVLDGNQVRDLLQRIATGADSNSPAAVSEHLPQRIVVRRAGGAAAVSAPIHPVPGKTTPPLPPSGARPKPRPFQESFVVRPGDRASVLWDQDGIRVVFSAICIDKGRRGDMVRARFGLGGRIIRAIVMNPGSLRIPS